MEFYTNDASGGGANVVGYMKLIVNGTAGNVWDLHFGASSNNAPSTTSLRLLSTGHTSFGSNQYVKIRDDIALTNDRKITIEDPYTNIDLTLKGDEITLKNNRTAAGGWARSLLRFSDDDGVNYFTMGSLGNAQAVTYNYLSGVDAHADPVIKWTTDGKLSLGQMGNENAPTYNLEAHNDLHLYGDLKATGAVSSGQITLSASNDNLDVSGVNSVLIDITSNIILGGLTGGVAGQIITFAYKGNYTNTITFEDTEGVGDQDIWMHSRADETFDGGGITFVCDGSNWFDCGHGRHI